MKPKPTTSSKLEKYLFKLCFEKIRQKGSHVFYKHSDGRYTTIPHHKGRVLSPLLIKMILKEIKISVEEYNKEIDKI